MTSRWIRKEFAALAASLTFFAGSASGQSSTIEVRSPSAKLAEVTPGKIVTASVVVANRGGDFDEINESFALPSGWTRIAPTDAPHRIEAGSQAIRVLAVNVPSTAESGIYRITYTAQSRRDPSSSATATFDITVSAVEELELEVESRPEPILAGDNYPIKVRVKNKGNGRIAIQLEAKSSLGYKLHLAPPTFALAPGETKELICRADTDKELQRLTNHTVTFDLRGVTPGGNTLTASQASVVDLIPLVSGDRELYHRLPLKLRQMTLLESGHEVRLQAELSGSGSLDEAGKHQVDFILRGPDIQDANLFGERDEFGLSYRGEHWKVDLGDRTFELSPLTERHTFARGVGAHYEEGTLATGAFFFSTTHRQENAEELGVYLRRKIGLNLSLQANFLRKWGRDVTVANALPQNIASISSQYRHGKELEISLEYARSRSDSGKSDAALFLEAHGQLFNRLSYSIEQTHASPDFHGYSNDTDSTYASLSLPIDSRLRLYGSVNRYSGNLEQNIERSTVVNREDSWLAGLSWTPDKQTDLTLEWQHVQRNDLLPPAAYAFREDFVRLGAGKNFGAIRLQSFLDLGTLNNSLTNEAGTFQRGSLFVSWQPTPRQNYSVFGVLGPSPYTGSRDNALNVGASANWQMRDNLSFGASYAHNQYDSLRGTQQDQATVTARYKMASQNEVSIVGRWIRSSATEDDESAVLFTFTHPFSIPVSRKTSVGSLQGIIRHGMQGLGRVVVMADQVCAVTDSAGAFEFPSLKPGAYSVRVVPDSLPANLVVATPQPAKVRIRSADTSKIRFDVIPAATLTVQVILGTSNPSAVQGFEGAVVELVRGAEHLTTQTDRKGAAIFERIPAGNWQVRISGDQLPPRTYLEQTDFPIELHEGKADARTIRILPLKRSIQIIDRGSLH